MIEYKLCDRQGSDILNHPEEMDYIRNNLCNNKKYFLFLDKLKEKFENLNLVYCDLTYGNIGILDNEFYIIDLESVVSFEKLGTAHNMTLNEYNCKLYLKILKNIFPNDSLNLLPYKIE